MKTQSRRKVEIYRNAVIKITLDYKDVELLQAKERGIKEAENLSEAHWKIAHMEPLDTVTVSDYYRGEEELYEELL